MSNYSRIVDYAAKDALTTGNAAKALKGTELGAEFDALATMSATKEDTANKNVASGYTGQNAANQSQALGFVPTGSAVPVNGMYLPGANTVGFASNTTARGSINASGNWSIPAPASGSVLQLIAVSGGISNALDCHGTLATDGSYVQFSRAALAGDGFVGSVGTAGQLLSNSLVGDLAVRGNTNGLLLGTGVTGIWRMNSAGAVQQLAPSSGIAYTVTGLAGTQAVKIVSPNTASSSFGLWIQAGTNSTDYAALVFNAAGSETFRIQGDGVLKLQSAGYTPSNAITFANPPTITFANSNVFTLAMTGNITSSAWGLTGPLDGQSFVIMIKQDATGGRTIVWPTNFWFSGGASPALSTAANAKDLFVGTYSSLNAGYFCSLATGFA